MFNVNFSNLVNTGTIRVHFVNVNICKYKNVLLNEEIPAFYFKHYTNKHISKWWRSGVCNSLTRHFILIFIYDIIDFKRKWYVNISYFVDFDFIYQVINLIRLNNMQVGYFQKKDLLYCRSHVTCKLNTVHVDLLVKLKMCNLHLCRKTFPLAVKPKPREIRVFPFTFIHLFVSHSHSYESAI